MKNSQKKTVKPSLTSKNAKGYKKGQAPAKRAGKAPVRPAPAAVQKKPPMPKEKKLFISLVALLCVFAISLVSLGSVYLVGVLSRVEYGSLYENISLKKYVLFGKSEYTDKKIDLSSIYAQYGIPSDAYTTEDMDEYIKALLLENRKEIALGQRSTVIGYGDDVGFYVVGVFLADENGKPQTPVLEKDFLDYSLHYYQTVGNGATLGQSFDEALIAAKLSPIVTYRQNRTNGTIDADDVITVSYTAVKAQNYAKDEWLTDKVTDSTLYTSNGSQVLAQKRLDLAAALSSTKATDVRFAQAILDGCKTIGQPFDFVLENWDSDGDSVTEEAVKYTVTVHAAVEEQSTDILFTVDDDYFTASSKNDHLNGKKLVARVILTTVDDYEVPAATLSTFKEIDEEFTTDKTADADVLSAFKAYSVDKLNASREEALARAKREMIYSALVSSLYPASFGASDATTVDEKFPEGAWSEAYARAYENLVNLYYSSGYASSYTLSQYIVNYVSSQTGSQYQTQGEALSAMAQQYVAYDLFMYFVLQNEGIKVTDEMLEKYYTDHVEGLISSYSASDSETEYNEAYFVEKLGKDALYTTARRNAVYDLVADFLLENNDVIYSK